MSAKVYEPGEAAQSDCTYMNSLGVTLGGVSFPHLVYHLVLVYSNIEAVQICFSESFESLVEGFETCLWQIGGTPRSGDRCDVGAVCRLSAKGRSRTLQRETRNFPRSRSERPRCSNTPAPGGRPDGETPPRPA